MQSTFQASTSSGFLKRSEPYTPTQRTQINSLILVPLDYIDLIKHPCDKVVLFRTTWVCSLGFRSKLCVLSSHDFACYIPNKLLFLSSCPYYYCPFQPFSCFLPIIDMTHHLQPYESWRHAPLTLLTWQVFFFHTKMVSQIFKRHILFLMLLSSSIVFPRGKSLSIIEETIINSSI